MCGVYGVITNRHKKLTEFEHMLKTTIISSLGLAMEERGNQSAGIAFIKENKIEIVKKAVSATDFVQSKEYIEAVEKDSQIILGHTRLKTHGEINDENAHPFRKGTIVGVHNGVINNYLEILPSAKVDSEAMFFQLDKDKGNYKKTFSVVRGRMALAWVDEQYPDAALLMRHEQPLFFTYSEDIDSIIWCSTEGALKSVLYAATGTLPEEVVQLEEDMVYRINGRLKIKKKPVTLKTVVYNNATATKSNKPAAALPAPHNPHTPLNSNSDWPLNIYSKKEERFMWRWGETAFFDSPSMGEQRINALLSGCDQCKKNISTDEAFYYHPEKDAVVHSAECLLKYIDRVFKPDELGLFFYSFTAWDHKKIRENIFLKKKEPAILDVGAEDFQPDLIGLDTVVLESSICSL